MTPHHSCSGRLPGPRAGGPDVPRLGRDGADRAAGDRGDGRVLRDLPRVDPPRRLPAGGALDGGLRGRPRPRRGVRGLHARRDGVHAQRDRGDQPRRVLVGARERRRRRPGRRHADGAPLQPRAVADPVPAGGRGARLRAGHRRRPARHAGARRPARAPPEAGRGRARLQRARHGQPDRRDRRARARRRRARARRRRPGRPAPAGRRRRAGRRLLRLDRPQGLRADRHRRAARPPRAAGGDAAVPRRRAHDHARRRLRVDLRGAARALRGGHDADRRGDRARRRRRLPLRARDGRRLGALPRRHGLRRRAPARPCRASRCTVPPSSSTAAASPRSPSRTSTRTTSPRSSAATASACAPATTAPSR